MILPTDNVTDYIKEIVYGINGVPKKAILSVMRKQLSFSRHKSELLLKSLLAQNLVYEDDSGKWIYPVKRDYSYDLTDRGYNPKDINAVSCVLQLAFTLAEYTLPRISKARFPYDYIIAADSKVYRILVCDNDLKAKIRYMAEEPRQTICPVINAFLCINTSKSQVKNMLDFDNSLDNLSEEIMYAEVISEGQNKTEIRIGK